ncbi:DUF192 domain-containing protein [Kineosporia succinea]|uniref:Uncharacterized membrane protein (UPF0127 family) n=1 Tax=Kineosporia succinea TaxID=84632 RepID=A0ABT9P3E1_9ACTN|nr:DUF192 domain-containing protein [Kineosporia succinea]MDP9826610.1 uncharacterized membrane protein (UPF0127 family) [Kineosporia succinea]
MTGLLLDGVEVAEVEVATSYRARARGLLGRDGIETGLVLRPGSSVHTFGMRFAIDVVHVRRDGLVLAVTTLAPGRMGRPRPRSRWILETEAGRARSWGIEPGRNLTLRG